jgi:outer membrane lipase/esterase
MFFAPIAQPAQRWIARLSAALFVCLSALALTACGGGGSTHDPFTPTKIISFGDNLSVISPSRYTVNTTGEVTTLVEQFAASYGISTATSATFVSLAVPNARIATTATFAATATTLSNQIAAYLSTNSVGSQDMFIITAGTVDIIDAYLNSATYTLDMEAAGVSLVNQVKALVNAGAKRIVVVPPYDMSVTPWGKTNATYTTQLNALTRHLNDVINGCMGGGTTYGCKGLALDGRVVVYAPIEDAMNQIVLNPSSYSLTDVTTPICDPASSATDSANGIGIGNGQLNSSRCSTSTLITVTDSTGTTSVTATLGAYAFADKVYPTPAINRSLGNTVYNAAYGR